MNQASSSASCPHVPLETVPTMTALLEQRAACFPDRIAFGRLTDEGIEEQISFGELDRRAKAIAARLALETSPGDRVLLVYPAGLEFITAFFGCLYAGVVATPTTYPKPRRPMPRTCRIAEDSDVRLALTTEQTLQAIAFDQQSDIIQALPWLGTDDIPDADSQWRRPEQRGEDLALLQYTSGSTSDPKGVMITHANLLANLEVIRVAFGLLPAGGPNLNGAGVFWLPAYHDMGLIGGVLTPLYVGGPSLLMSPPSFLQRPLRWLQAIHEHRAAISGAPNFAYEFCVQRTTPEERAALDLSCWRLAFCGAEPINAQTLIDFTQACQAAKFDARALYPCYGLAESTLLAAGPVHGAPPHYLSVDQTALRNHRVVVVPPGEADRPGVQRLVGCGQSPDGARVEIVDPESQTPLPEGRVGEIFLQGPSVSQGYWRQERETAEAFDRSVVGLPGTFLRTGDLGFFHEGNLYVTGRIKDVIIIRGVNYYPQDIEQTAGSAHEAVLPGAAFALQIDDYEQLVVVHQIARSCQEDQYEKVIEAIRRAIVKEHEVDPSAIILIRQSSLPLTSSGKVQRNLCRRQFLEGQLNTVHRWISPVSRLADKASKTQATLPRPKLDGLTIDQATEQIVEWLQAWLVQRTELRADQIDADKPFAEMGVDSLTGVELSHELEEALGIPLPPVIAWNYPTPGALSRYLAQKSLGSNDPGDALTKDHEVESLLTDIENLSEEEASRLLSED